MNWITILAPIAGICALLFAYFLIIRIKRMDPGTERMKEIAANIHSGAMAFFKTIIESFGVDSYAGRVSAVMLGSSETTMYTVSVYYGAAGVKKTRHTIPCALIGDITAFISAGVLIRLFFK